MRAAVAALLLAPPVLAGPAVPGGADRLEAARRHALRGAELYRAGDHRAAARAFETSWGLAPRPTTALNVAQAYEGAGEPSLAIRWYERVLLDRPEPALVERARTGLAHVRAHGYVEVRCAPVAAHVVLDGRPWGACPRAGGYVVPGTRLLSIRAEGYTEDARSVQVTAATRTELRVELEPAPPPPAEKADPPAPHGGGGDLWSWVGWSAIAAGALAATVGGYFYVRARADAAEAPTGPSPGEVAEHARRERAFESNLTVAWIAFGAAAALAGTGTAVLLWPSGDAPSGGADGVGVSLVLELY